MHRTWIVVCDGSRARFFMTRSDRDEWVKFEELDHPEEMRFAHFIAETLDTAHSQRAFDRLIIVAPPAFLGQLRRAMGENVKKSIYATLDKDYTHLDADELHERIAVP